MVITAKLEGTQILKTGTGDPLILNDLVFPVRLTSFDPVDEIRKDGGGAASLVCWDERKFISDFLRAAEGGRLGIVVVESDCGSLVEVLE